MWSSRATVPGAHGPQSRRAVSSSALAPRSPWLHTAALHVVMMEGPFLDTRIAGGKLALHGRFIHLATKVLIRERAVLHLQPEEDAAQLPVPAEPLVPHHVVTALWDKAKSILSAIRRRCHLCDPSLSPPAPQSTLLPSSSHLLARQSWTGLSPSARSNVSSPPSDACILSTQPTRGPCSHHPCAGWLWPLLQGSLPQITSC